MPPSALLAALRRRTAPLHARLDAALSEPATRTGYIAFLRATLAAQRQVLPAIARWLPRPDDELRLASLRADLGELDAPPPDAPPAALALPESQGAAYGAAYVVEGSTLGGLVLAERFEAALGSVPTRYLRLRGQDTAARWRAFLADLEAVAQEQPAAHHEDACVAAVASFAAYRAAFVAHGVIRDD